MPKMSKIKNPKSKSTIEKRDEGTDRKMEEEVYHHKSKDTPFKGTGGGCAEEKDAPEDLDILGTSLANCSAAKKRKNEVEDENFINAAIKTLSDLMKKQEMDRNQAQMTLQHRLASMLTQMESDSKAMKECNKQLQQSFRSQQKLALRIESAHAQRLQALSEINENYWKQCKEMEIRQRDDADQAELELAAKFKELQQKLASDYRRKSAEALKKAYANFY